jgi:hypothetical protein
MVANAFSDNDSSSNINQFMKTKHSLQPTQDPTQLITLNHQHNFLKICFKLITRRICSRGVEELEHEFAYKRLRMHGAIPPLPYILTPWKLVLNE